MSQLWDDLLTEEEREVIRRSGYGGRKNVGKFPVLLVIDAQYNFFGARKPLLEQLDEYPTGIGIIAWESVGRSANILNAARAARIPIIFTRYVAGSGEDSHESRMSRDHTKFTPDAPGSEIIEELKPMPGETVIDKTFASAFFGTELINRLIGYSADTLLIMGGTTSGCVRTTAIDASNYGFRTVIIEDCVFDRISVSHKVALLDVWMKYGILMNANEVSNYLVSLKKER